MRARVSATLLLISQILNSSLVDVRTAVLPWSARVGFLASLAETFTRARRSMTRMSDDLSGPRSAGGGGSRSEFGACGVGAGGSGELRAARLAGHALRSREVVCRMGEREL